MPIRIAHDPVGTPMLASYMTGAGEAQKRAVGRRQEMQLAYDKTAARSAEHWQNQFFEAEQRRLDRLNTAQGNLQRDFIWDPERGYIHKDVWGQEQDAARAGEKAISDNIYGEVEAREKFLRENRLSPAGMEAAKEASWSLDWIRQRAARGEDRPGVTQQYMSQWLREFDARNPQSWMEQQGDPWQAITEAGGFISPQGTKMTLEDFNAGKPIGGVIGIGRDGKPGLNLFKGAEQGGSFPATSQEYFSDQNTREDMRKRAIAELQAERLGDEEKAATPPIAQEIRDKMQELYEFDKSLVTPSPQQAGAQTPAAQVYFGDKTIGMMDMAGAQADRQWAANTIAELSALYPHIKGAADIKNPKDREELEKALQVMEQQTDMETPRAKKPADLARHAQRGLTTVPPLQEHPGYVREQWTIEGFAAEWDAASGSEIIVNGIKYKKHGFHDSPPLWTPRDPRIPQLSAEAGDEIWEQQHGQ